jgi:hypothetical protein
MNPRILGVAGTWVALLAAVQVGPAVLAEPPGSWRVGESVSGEDAPCGYGEWHVGAEVVFSHEIQFTVQVTPTSGYYVDCMKGVDAYLELYHVEPSAYYYYVWGQLGDLGYKVIRT